GCNRSVRALVLVYVANMPHRPLVADVLTGLHKRQYLCGAGALSRMIGLVIRGVAIIGMRCAIAVIHCRQTVDWWAILTSRRYGGVMIHDPVGPRMSGHSIVRIDPGQHGRAVDRGIVKLQVSAARLFDLRYETCA